MNERNAIRVADVKYKAFLAVQAHSRRWTQAVDRPEAYVGASPVPIPTRARVSFFSIPIDESATYFITSRPELYRDQTTATKWQPIRNCHGRFWPRVAFRTPLRSFTTVGCRSVQSVQHALLSLVEIFPRVGAVETARACCR